MRCVASILMLVVMLMTAAGVPQALHARDHEVGAGRPGVQGRVEGERCAGHEGGLMILGRWNDACGRAGEGITEKSDDSSDRGRGHGPHGGMECVVCMQLHAPGMMPGGRAWLIDTGVWVRYVSMLAESQRPQTCPERLTCRGPPEVPSC